MGDTGILLTAVVSVIAAVGTALAIGEIAEHRAGIASAYRRVRVEVAAVWLWVVVTVTPPRRTYRRWPGGA